MNIPQPKYTKGQTVWAARESSSTERLPCPDCLGSQVWKVITPAGSELEYACARCTGGSLYGPSIPSLNRVTWEPYVEKLTIGSIRIDTDDVRNPVTYMCAETGVGSGTIWNESMLHASEDDAQRDAQALATKRILDAEALPERINQHRVGSLQLKDAQLLSAEQSLWGAWYSYRRLREEIDNHLCDECKENARFDLQWEDKHRETQPFERVLRAARALLDRVPDEELSAAIDALPFPMALCVTKEESEELFA